MLTPIEIQDKSFKSGIGYDKRDVDAFLRDILTNYELLYTKNAELEERVTVLSEGLAHYKSNEKSIQKALVLAQNVADEIVATANKKAQAIEEKAYAKSDEILLNSKSELNRLNSKIAELTMQFENYKNSCRHFAQAQIEMLDNSIITPVATTKVDVAIQSTEPKISTPVKAEPAVTQTVTQAVTQEDEGQNVEDYTVNIDFDDFDEAEVNAIKEICEPKKVEAPSNTEEIKNVSNKNETILSFDNTFAEVKENETKTELADEFNIGITFSENTKFNPNDSIRYYEEQVSEKEDKIVKEAGIDDEFIFDDIDDDAKSIGIDFDFLNTRK